MPFQPSPRLTSVLATLATAGLVLTAAGCGQLTPLGPDVLPALPQPHHLRAPFVLQAMSARFNGPAGGCPAGFRTLTAPGATSGVCYRKIGTPVTVTSAAVSPVTVLPQNTPPGQQPGPAQYGFMLTLPAADVAALTALTTTAANVRGPLTISVTGRTWILPIVAAPFRGQRFMIPLPSEIQAIQLQRILS
jgi:hypothetical protein